MIRVLCREETYVYNAYHMVRAFYPSETAETQVEEKASPYVTVRFPSGKELAVTEELVEAQEVTLRERKRRIDRCLYRLLEAESGRSLAWGILMGVRPTKLAMQKREEGESREAFLSWFMREYLVSRKKAVLAWEIAGREKTLLDRLDYRDGYSLYVGIPFCPSVCTYCSFSSGALSDWQDQVDDYLYALLKELDFIGRVSKEKKLNTIYIGGGTPTSLSAAQLERLLAFIDQRFSREHLLEYTVEAGRPDSITKEKLKVLKAHGVTRISINPQSMQQKTLDAIGRRHTVVQVAETFCMARAEGFDNINMDLIAGLPGETQEDMEDTLAQIHRLGPDSLTVHSLAVKRAAQMGRERKEAQQRAESASESGTRSGSDGNRGAQVAGMILAAAEAAGEMDMRPYYLYRQKNIAGNFENVGYAKVDKAGIYNILIMEEKQSIVAAGAGASTKLVLSEPIVNPEGRKQKKTNLIRLENVKAIDAYIRRIDEMIDRKGEWLWR